MVLKGSILCVILQKSSEEDVWKLAQMFYST